MEPNQPQNKLLIVFSTIQKIAIVIVIAFAIRYFLIQPFIIDGNSMEPDFHNNEFILIDKISYRFNEPNRGDVIVFENPKDPSVYFIKRIIAIPGDTVKIAEGKVYVNGELKDEPYIEQGKGTQVDSDQGVLEETIPENQYFVMGDNRDESSDSREWGLLPRMNIVGKLWFVLYPLQLTQPDYTSSLSLT